MPKIKGSQVNFCNTVAKGPQRKPKFALSLVKMLDIYRVSSALGVQKYRNIGLNDLKI